MLTNTNDYLQALELIKKEIARTRARAVRTVNSELICMYWRIGAECICQLKNGPQGLRW